MADALAVYLQGERVGTLRPEPPRGMAFQYACAWLRRHRVPLSVSLPIQSEPLNDARVAAFFANLLPEGAVRDDICRRLGISARNDYALLAAIGGDCAGAIVVCGESARPPRQGRYRPVSETALRRWLAEVPRLPLLLAAAPARLSLAGARQKLPLRYWRERWAVPIDGAASSHILKPHDPQWPDLPLNESFCMALAQGCGLDVAAAGPWPSEREPLALCVTRYDRVIGANGRVRRLHQEDFCQALGYAPEQKYQREGGPSLAQCFQLVQQHVRQPMLAKQQLIRWTVFNLLIGNADAHAKNLSLLHLEAGSELAPFYDLVSTAVYPAVEEKLAMKIGHRYEVRRLSLREWQRLADEAQLTLPYVRDEIRYVTAIVYKQADLLGKLFSREWGNPPMVRRLLDVIAHRIPLVRRSIE